MSLNLFSRLMPAEEAFTPLFCEQAKCVLRRCRAAAGDDRRRTIPPKTARCDHSRDRDGGGRGGAQDLRRRQPDVQRAHRSRGHPEPRPLLDDCVDLIEDTAKGIQRYGVRGFPADMRAMAHAVVEAAAVLQKVMPLLDSIAKDHRTISALCEQVGQIEGRADASFDLGAHALCGRSSVRRDRHDRLHRPQGTVRVDRERRRQV